MTRRHNPVLLSRSPDTFGKCIDPINHKLDSGDLSMGTAPPPREVARGCSSSTLGATPAHVIQATSVSRLSKSPKCPTHQDTYKAREAVAMQTLPSYESLESTDTSKHRAQHPKPKLASQLAKQYIARKDGSMEEAEVLAELEDTTTLYLLAVLLV